MNILCLDELGNLHLKLEPITDLPLQKKISSFLKIAKFTNIDNEWIFPRSNDQVRFFNMALQIQKKFIKSNLQLETCPQLSEKLFSSIHENSFDKSAENALKINEYMPKYICNSIEKKLDEMGFKKTVLVCGLAYKANVEDMRDSPSFKIIQEMKQKGFIIYGYDPFFDSKLSEKYLIENHIKELNFKNLENIDDESIKEISCLCIVQHHAESKIRIKEIYDKSLIPFIYDCQSKLLENPQSNSKIDHLGN